MQRLQGLRLVVVQVYVPHRIYQHVARTLLFGGFEALLRDVLGLDRARLCDDRDAELLAERLQLLGRGHTAGVRPDHQGTLAEAAQVQGQLRDGGGLARALETEEHHDGRRLIRLRELCRATTQHLNHLLVDDVDDLLGRCQALENVGAGSLLTDGGDELLDDAVVDVRFEQGETNLAKGFVEVLLRDRATAAELPENALQLIG